MLLLEALCFYEKSSVSGVPLWLVCKIMATKSGGQVDNTESGLYQKDNIPSSSSGNRNSRPFNNKQRLVLILCFCTSGGVVVTGLWILQSTLRDVCWRIHGGNLKNDMKDNRNLLLIPMHSYSTVLRSQTPKTQIYQNSIH